MALVIDRSRLLKLFDVLGVVIALCVLAAWMYGMQLRNWYRTRTMRKAMPAVSLVPQPLPNTNSNGEKGVSITEFGYQMNVPWGEITAHRTEESLAAYIFAGGRGLTISNPAVLKNILQITQDASEPARRAFMRFLGAKTGYDLLNSELNMTPQQLTPFMRKTDSARRSVLLNLKAVELTRDPSAIYSFSANGMRGFQLGDPSKDRRVQITAFDARDHELRLMIGADPHSNVTIQQSEINELLQALRPATTSDGH